MNTISRRIKSGAATIWTSCHKPTCSPQNTQSFSKSSSATPTQLGSSSQTISRRGKVMALSYSGIFLLKKINQLKKIVPGANLNAAFKNFNMNEIYVISRYIDNPLLIGGKKFDLRIYVLVTSYRPIKAYLYDQGFGRFCN